MSLSRREIDSGAANHNQDNFERIHNYFRMILKCFVRTYDDCEKSTACHMKRQFIYIEYVERVIEVITSFSPYWIFTKQNYTCVTSVSHIDKVQGRIKSVQLNFIFYILLIFIICLQLCYFFVPYEISRLIYICSLVDFAKKLN